MPALAGGEEEVDVVLGPYGLEDDLEPDRLCRRLPGAGVPRVHRQLAGGADRQRLAGGPGLFDQLPGLGDVWASTGELSYALMKTGLP